MAKPGYGPRKRKKPAAVRETAVADAPAADTARLFWNGRSQAVRLPKAFRFEGDAVRIRRSGDAVILEPLKPRDWPPGFWGRVSDVSPDFFAAAARPRGDTGLRIPDFDAP